jgi:hypothetical protein
MVNRQGINHPKRLLPAEEKTGIGFRVESGNTGTIPPKMLKERSKGRDYRPQMILCKLVILKSQEVLL